MSIGQTYLEVVGGESGGQEHSQGSGGGGSLLIYWCQKWSDLAQKYALPGIGEHLCVLLVLTSCQGLSKRVSRGSDLLTRLNDGCDSNIMRVTFARDYRSVVLGVILYSAGGWVGHN